MVRTYALFGPNSSNFFVVQDTVETDPRHSLDSKFGLIYRIQDSLSLSFLRGRPRDKDSNASHLFGRGREH